MQLTWRDNIIQMSLNNHCLDHAVCIQYNNVAYAVSEHQKSSEALMTTTEQLLSSYKWY